MKRPDSSTLASAGFGALSWFFERWEVALAFALTAAACWAVAEVAMETAKGRP